MLANTITCSRLLFTFIVIGMFGKHNTLNFLLIGAIAFIFLLDAMDGIVARRRNETSKIGALLDTIADRIIENTFWIYFTSIELIPLWMSITVMARGFIVDNLQRRFGTPKNGWAIAITGSRTSRGLYGCTKMFTFMSLMSTRVFNEFPILEQVSPKLAILTVVICVIRGLPTFIEAYKTIGRRETHAKHVRPVPQNTEELVRKSKISKKAFR